MGTLILANSATVKALAENMLAVVFPVADASQVNVVVPADAADQAPALSARPSAARVRTPVTNDLRRIGSSPWVAEERVSRGWPTSVWTVNGHQTDGRLHDRQVRCKHLTRCVYVFLNLDPLTVCHPREPGCASKNGRGCNASDPLCAATCRPFAR